MHPERRRRFVSVFVSVVVSLIAVSCGGGGSGGSGSGGVQSSPVALKSVLTAFDVALSSNGSQPAKPSFSKTESSGLSDPEKVLQAFEQFSRSLDTTRTKGLEAVHVLQSNCPGGGTEVITVDDRDTPEKSDDSVTVTVSQCVETKGTLTSLADGTFFFEPLQNGYRIVYTHFLSRLTDGALGRTAETSLNGVIKVTGSQVACGDKQVLESATLSINLTGSGRLDETGDGTFERDDAFSMTNYVIHVSVQFSPAPDCIPTATTFTLHGGMSVTDQRNSANDFSATFNGIEMNLARATRTIGGVDQAGSTLRLSGAIQIDSGCTSGTFTLSTPAETPFFFPAGKSCAVDGKILITQGNLTTAVVATDKGGIQIDKGDDGVIDQTFSDCKEADACT